MFYSYKSLFIVFEIILIAVLALSFQHFVQNGVQPISSVYWAAIAVQFVLAWLTYKYYKTWGLWIILLPSLGIIFPIIFYNLALNSIKLKLLMPFTGTYIYYILFANSFFLYRSFAKEKDLQNDFLLLVANWTSVILRVFYSIIIITIIISIILILVFGLFFSVPAQNVKNDLFGFEIVLGIIFIIPILLGYFWPKLAKWNNTVDRNDFSVGFGCTIRMCLFVTPAFLMYVLTLAGFTPWFTISVMILCLIGLILAFPTERKLLVWRNIKANNPEA
jgi:hypothetical protein